MILLSTLIISHLELVGDVLPVPECQQEVSNWCWAGVTASVLGYYGQFIAQCVIANYARSHSTRIDFGTTDCCKDPYQGCNEGNYGWGDPGSVENILLNWGVESIPSSGPLTMKEVKGEIIAERPFLISWAWDNGGGHFLVGHGFIDDKLYLMDPWIGEGKSIINYDWVVSGGGHNWTSTMFMTTEIAKELKINYITPVKWEKVYGLYPLTVDAYAPAGISSVEFYVDHQLVGSDSSPPYSYHWNTMVYRNNKYSIAAVVIDKVGKKRTEATEIFVKNVTINIDVMRRSEQAWLIRRDYGVVTFVVENVDLEIVDSCVLYRKEGSGNYQQIANFAASVVSQRIFVHQERFLTAGKSYTYKAVVLDKMGQIIAFSQEVTI